MSTQRTDDNMQIGRRLKETRINMKLSKSEVADVLCVLSEHYRKLEAGSTGISVDKLLILYHTYGIDPTYLITGVKNDKNEFDLDYYLANSTSEQKSHFFQQVFSFLLRILKTK